MRRRALPPLAHLAKLVFAALTGRVDGATATRNRLNECAPSPRELILLAFAKALPQLAALAMEHGPSELVAALAAVELHQNAAAVRLVVDVAAV